jgi:hypothetical protein
MALIQPDWTEETQPVKPGVYSARIKECDVKTSQKGSTYGNWKLELFGTPEVNNRVVFMATPFSGKGIFRLADLYKAATGEEIDRHANFDTEMLIGKEITVTLVEGKDQNGNTRQYPDVKSVSKLS